MRNGESIPANKTDELKLYPGDLVLVETGGGGGYGAPTERPIEDVVQDVRRGLVSQERAEHDYGVRLMSDGTAQRVPTAPAAGSGSVTRPR